MKSRRAFIKFVGGVGAVLLCPGGGWSRTPVRNGKRRWLDATGIPKFVRPLLIPPPMPLSPATLPDVDLYDIAVREFMQEVLPPSLPATRVWGYGSIHHPGTVAEGGTFNFPSFTIEARWRRPVRVRWINDLKDPVSGSFLPHLLPVDPTLHWANPPGGAEGRDMRPMFAETPGPYLGPVPIVTHVHGAHTHQESDGYAEAWYLPDAADLPEGYARVGTFHDIFKASSPLGPQWGPGSALFEYPNDQRAAALWFHDHTLGMTRLNVYAGPAGFYLIRGGPGDNVGGVLPGSESASGGPIGEIPLAIQDRSFYEDGGLLYPDSREFFDGYDGPYAPESPVAPIWNPEFFGDAMLVNGRTWPWLEVEQRRYRFRLLNGCNSRFLLLKFDRDLPFWQIGAEGGFLRAPVRRSEVLMSPAERADVIVDFSGVAPGTVVHLLNLGPDEPFSGGLPGQDFEPANPATTGRVLQVRVVPARGADPSTAPELLVLPEIPSVGAARRVRKLALVEEEYHPPGEEPIPTAALLGQVDQEGEPHPQFWEEPPTENVAFNSVETWELHNFTADAHPIHVHQVMFEVVNRQPMGGEPVEPEPWERGFKDTVIAYPDQVTRIKARFDLPGLFVWHCHIVEHEDNEMMRPFRVLPPGIMRVRRAPEGAAVDLEADVEPGRRYRLQKTTDLAGSTWEDLQEFVATDPVFSLRLADPAAQSRCFYRLLPQ